MRYAVGKGYRLETRRGHSVIGALKALSSLQCSTCDAVIKLRRTSCAEPAGMVMRIVGPARGFKTIVHARSDGEMLSRLHNRPYCLTTEPTIRSTSLAVTLMSLHGNPTRSEGCVDVVSQIRRLKRSVTKHGKRAPEDNLL